MFAVDGNTIDKRTWIRLGIWGCAVLFAIGVVAVASRSEIGVKRIKAAYAIITGTTEAARPAAPAPQMLARPSELEEQTRRLADALKVIAQDRDRLMVRVSSLERDLEDRTGSIERKVDSGIARSAASAAAAQAAAVAAAAAPKMSAPATTPAASTQPDPASLPAITPTATSSSGPSALSPSLGPSVASMIAMAPARLPPSASFSAASRVMSAHAIANGENPAEDSVSSRTEFGVDLGGAATTDGLRVLWLNAKGAQGPVFEGLRPLVAVREAKSGAVELRLIVGPLANAGAAAKLCATLASSGLPCQQTVFDGQKLALR